MTTTSSVPIDRDLLVEQLRELGIADGTVVMVHASMRAIGPVHGGAKTVAEGLLEAVGVRGTIMAHVSWDRSPYDETLNGRRLPWYVRESWPAFDPKSASPYLPYGVLNQFLCDLRGAVRSHHPDASMVAIGASAESLMHPHRFGEAYGPGSPLERFVELGGKVLCLGSNLDSVTVLHYAEAIAEVPGKRRVTYEMPVLNPLGSKAWVFMQDFDSNAILDVFAEPGAADPIQRITLEYLAQGRHRSGRVGNADALLMDARDLVAHGKRWLESRYATAPGPTLAKGQS